MCGINGIIRFDRESISEDEIRVMNRRIVHRGPDDQGVFIDNGVGLGHVRLSILDLSSRGHQPMPYELEGRKAVITYNGEVYNFIKLRKELSQKGYPFKSNTDTEVILASYLEYGFDCIQRFNGMFAFAIYDMNRQIIFGARDRFGVKPFKYYLDQDQFIFSSEIKAILENKIEREIDFDAVDDYLTLQYVPSPRTGFKNIHKLPHAHYFILDLKTRNLKIERYFDLDYSRKLELTEKEWMDLIEGELDKSVKRRLIADVPLGAFLSGGVDSSAIVAFMSKFTNKVKTFSISFENKDFDESAYARRVADIYQTDHTEFKVQSKDLLNYIEELVYQYEEPYADSSQLPTFILSKLTRKYVTVALSGDAGDENFGGYEKYRRHVLVKKYKLLLYPLLLLRPIVRLGGKIIKKEAIDKLYIFLRTFNCNVAKRHFNYTSYFDEFTKEEFYKEDFKAWLDRPGNFFERIIKDKCFDEMDQVFYLDFNTYIPDDINVKVDMASMANALEVRSPMLDYEFVQTMAAIPYEMKTDIRQGKKIFKKMLLKYLPQDILYRKKQGFAIPIKYWFREELREYVKKIILDERGLVLDILKKERVKKLIEDHMDGKDNAKKLWTLLVLNLWYQKYFQDSSRAA